MQIYSVCLESCGTREQAVCWGVARLERSSVRFARGTTSASYGKYLRFTAKLRYVWSRLCKLVTAHETTVLNLKVSLMTNTNY